MLEYGSVRQDMGDPSLRRRAARRLLPVWFKTLEQLRTELSDSKLKTTTDNEVIRDAIIADTEVIFSTDAKAVQLIANTLVARVLGENQS